MRRETCINERAEVLADGFPSVPICNTKVTDGVLGEAIKALAEGLVVNFLPER